MALSRISRSLPISALLLAPIVGASLLLPGAAVASADGSAQPGDSAVSAEAGTAADQSAGAATGQEQGTTTGTAAGEGSNSEGGSASQAGSGDGAGTGAGNSSDADDDDLFGSGSGTGASSGAGTGSSGSSDADDDDLFGGGSSSGSTDSDGGSNSGGAGTEDEDEELGPENPTTPPPAAPNIDPGFTPVDSPEHKVWLGEFSGGLGAAIARGTCDVTGDGKPDIISGNVSRSEWKYDRYYWQNPNHGWVQNVTGAVQIIPGGTPGAALSAANSTTIIGPRQTQEEGVDATIGLAVACLGDTNGDGVDDLAVGSHTMGRVWVINGGDKLAEVDLSNLTAAQGFVVKLPEFGAPAVHISRVGDVNGDGLADLSVVHSNLRLVTGAAQDQGAAYIVAGDRTGAEVDLSNPLEENPRLIARVLTPAGHVASSFTPVGDVNGDKQQDYVLADYSYAPSTNLVAGRAWLLTGVKAGSRVDLSGAFEGSTIDVALTTESRRLSIGNSVAAAGDVDGDSFGDFVIGYDGGSAANVGRGGVALISGSDKLPATITIRPDATVAAAGAPVKLITGAAAGDGFGYAVDVLVGEKGAGLVAVGAERAAGGDGRTYVFPLSAFSAPVRSVSELADVAVTHAAPGAKSRSGRSVAFVGGLLDGPTLAIGGDAVIHDPAGDEGWAHAAHVMALRVTLPQAAAPADPSPQPSIEPTVQPSQDASQEPSVAPTVHASTAAPTGAPSAAASTKPAGDKAAKPAGKGQLAKTGLTVSPLLAAGLLLAGAAVLGVRRRVR
ncbi:MAG: hypothetical protein Q3999_06505 [Buchananella hordeovulneris]|nr:hypothetical protein [Buchananella hordeovulneris]